MVDREESTLLIVSFNVSVCSGRSSPGGPGAWVAQQSCACPLTHCPGQREPTHSAPPSMKGIGALCSPCFLVLGCVTACWPQLSLHLFGIYVRLPQTHGPCGSPSHLGTLAGCERQPRQHSCVPGHGGSCLPLQVGPGSVGAMGLWGVRGSVGHAEWKGCLVGLSEDKPVHDL